MGLSSADMSLHLPSPLEVASGQADGKPMELLAFIILGHLSLFLPAGISMCCEVVHNPPEGEEVKQEGEFIHRFTIKQCSVCGSFCWFTVSRAHRNLSYAKLTSESSKLLSSFDFSNADHS